jgi:hypothetical protein
MVGLKKDTDYSIGMELGWKIAGRLRGVSEGWQIWWRWKGVLEGLEDGRGIGRQLMVLEEID